MLLHKEIQKLKNQLLQLYKAAIHLHPFNYNREIQAAFVSLQKHRGITTPDTLQSSNQNLWQTLCLQSNQRVRELEGWDENPNEGFLTQLFIYLEDCKERKLESELMKLAEHLLVTYKLRMAFILLNNLLDKALKLEQNKAALSLEDYATALQEQIYKPLRMIPSGYQAARDSPIEHLSNTACELDKQLFALGCLMQPLEIKQVLNFIHYRKAQAIRRYTEQNDNVRKQAMENFYDTLYTTVMTFDPTSPRYVLESLEENHRIQRITTDFGQISIRFKSQKDINQPRGYDTELKNVLIILTGVGLLAQLSSLATGHGLIFKPETTALQTVEHDSKMVANKVKHLVLTH